MIAIVILCLRKILAKGLTVACYEPHGILSTRVVRKIGRTAHKSVMDTPSFRNVVVTKVIKGSDGLQYSSVCHAHEAHGTHQNTVGEELLQAFLSSQVLGANVYEKEMGYKRGKIQKRMG